MIHWKFHQLSHEFAFAKSSNPKAVALIRTHGVFHSSPILMHHFIVCGVFVQCLWWCFGGGGGGGAAAAGGAGGAGNSKTATLSLLHTYVLSSSLLKKQKTTQGWL